MYKFDIEGSINKKIQQFEERNIIIEYEDVEKYLMNIYLKKQRVSDQALIDFVNMDNIDEIVAYLMSEAIINPKY